MGPRVKKPRSGKAKDLPSSADADQEVIDGGEEKIVEETELQKEVPTTEVDNGGEAAPPLKKSRGRQNVKKGNLKPPAKGKAAPAADEEHLDEEPEDNGAEENTDKVSSADEETLPAKKVRGRTKRVTKNEVGKMAAEGEEQHKEDLDSAAPGARKGRAKKKKVDDDDDEPEVMPKKKERGARKNESVAEVTPADEGTDTTNVEESKMKVTKREKKQPPKKGGKGKKDRDEEEKMLEDEEVDEKKIENGNDVEQSESEQVQDIDGGGGNAKAAKKPARGKTAAKAADVAVNKKPVGRGKKAAKEDLTGDNDVPVDGKKLRVLVEHCKS